VVQELLKFELWELAEKYLLPLVWKGQKALVLEWESK